MNNTILLLFYRLKKGLKEIIMCHSTHKKNGLTWAILLCTSLFVLPVSGQAPAQREPNIHIVEQGENLYRIAKENGLTIDQILELNNLRSQTIFPGQRLVVGFHRHQESYYSEEASLQNDRFNLQEPDNHFNTQQSYVEEQSRPAKAWNDNQANEPVAITHIRVMGRERPSGNLYSMSLGDAGNHIANSEYSNPTVSDDIQMLSHILSDQEGKTYRKVEIMPFDEIDEALDKLRYKIDQLKTRAASNDLLMINIYGTTQNRSRGVEIVPSRYGNSVSRGEPLTLDFIVNSLRSISCRKILICDVNLTRQQLNEYLRQHHLQSQEVAFIASCWNEASYSSRGNWNHGAIFRALREALAGKADMNQNGEITLTEVDMYLNDRVMELTGNVQYAQLIANHLRDHNPVLAYLY